MFMWHRVLHSFYIGRGREAENKVLIFIWVPPQGALTVHNYSSLIQQFDVHDFKDGEHCY